MMSLQRSMPASVARNSNLWVRFLNFTALSTFLSFGLAPLAFASDGDEPSLTKVSDVDGVQSVQPLANGNFIVVLDSGEVIELTGRELISVGGELYITDPGLAALGLTDSDVPLGLILGGVAAGLGGVAILAGGGSDGGSDGGTTAPVNVAPVFTSSSTASFTENGTGTAYTATATDADSASLTYSLSGTDAALFNINASSGAVTFIAAPDFEAPADAGANNVYDVTVTVSDGARSTTQAVAITVTDENEAPAFTSGEAASFTENDTGAVYTAVATDAESTALTYSLSGADAALFNIDAATGVVTFIAAPDFEAPADSGADNVYDVTVTANDGVNTTDQAVTITVTDVFDQVSLANLDGTNGFRLDGIDVSDRSGISVSSAGDVNGDGYDDLIIGADGGDPNGFPNFGESYVVYGGASAPGTDGVFELSALDGINGFRIDGAESSRSGYSVSSAGDVNGDGFDDLIIGAYRADPNGNRDAGESYVVYGGVDAPGTDGVFDLSDLDGSNGFRLQGIGRYDTSGASLSSAGDVNGDGYDDLIIGALFADPNGRNAVGESYVVFGGTSSPGTAGVFDLSTLDGTTGFRLEGIDVVDLFGRSVSSAGDVNGDGFDDLIIGADGGDPNGNSDAGESYVVFGGTSLPGTAGVFSLSDLDGTNGFRIDGIDAYDESGISVSSAGDVNGDGFDDLIIGAPDADSGGESYIVYGGANAPGTAGILALADLDGTNGFRIDGIGGDDESGGSVSSAGDVNGDGFDDLIIGAHGADTVGGIYAGESYVVYGGASAPGTAGVFALADLDSTTGFRIDGVNTDDESGLSVSSAGDVNGDGFDDLIIGAPYADPNGNSYAGESYVVYGGATGTESTVAVSAIGTSVADNFIGNAGADSLIGGGGADVLRGGAGDDILSVADLSFADIDGGTGVDTLVLTGAGQTLDVTGAGNAGLDSIEIIDLTGSGDNRLVLDQLAIFDLTEERDGGTATLTVRGDTGDTVDLSAGGFTANGSVTIDSVVFNIFENDNAVVQVEQGVDITPSFTSGTTASFAENTDGAVYTAVATTNADSAALTYSLSGADAALFSIDAATGVVSFITAPDFEAPADAGGDNVYDVTVTANDGANSTDQAVAITVSDVVELADLDGTNGFRLDGIDTNSFSGRTVSSAGDVNGDGFDDLIIGAVRANPNGVTFAGESYVVYGGSNAPGTAGAFDLSTLDGSNGFRLDGINRLDESGNSVSSAGDVNGDGFDDLIIGARRADPNGVANAGESYVVYGGSSALGTAGVFDLSMLDGTNGFRIEGIGRSDSSGGSVSSAGDVNGDGFDDLIIGAPGGNGFVGESYIVYGGANAPGTAGVFDLSDLDGTNGFRLDGINRFDDSGSSVSSAGDINGDGFDDLIIGAPQSETNVVGDAGESYVVYGGPNVAGAAGVFDLSDLDGTNGFRLDGIDEGDYSGGSVSSAGDVNGDGLDDLIIGAIDAAPNGNIDAGESYIVYGGSSAPGTAGVFDLSTLDGTNGFRLDGITAGDRSGRSVSSAGDMNGDGFDDLIIGALNADPNGVSNAGESYVVYGGANAPGTDGVFDLSDLDGTNGFRIEGIGGSDRSGLSASSAGDVNGDGFDDLIIGAPYADPNGSYNAGESYVVYGGATGTESTVAVSEAGTSVADNFIGNAGDDSLIGGGGADVLRGGAGDDILSVADLSFADIDGGTGADTLVLTGAGQTLDVTGAGNAGLDSIEIIDLTGSGNNTLIVDQQAVFDLTEERDGGTATLTVRGDTGDTVDLSDGGFTANGSVTIDSVVFNIFENENAIVQVEQGVSVDLTASSSSSVKISPSDVSDTDGFDVSFGESISDDSALDLTASMLVDDFEIEGVLDFADFQDIDVFDAIEGELLSVSSSEGGEAENDNSASQDIAAINDAVIVSGAEYQAELAADMLHMDMALASDGLS